MTAAKKTRTKTAPTPTRADAELARLATDDAELAGSITMAELESELARLATDDSVIAADGSIRPVEIGKRGRKGADQVHIFTLEGTKFYIPAVPNRLVLSNYLRKMRAARTQGAADEATLDLLMKLLGRDAVEQLESSPEVAEEDVADVLTAVTKVAFGAIATLTEGLASGN